MKSMISRHSALLALLFALAASSALAQTATVRVQAQAVPLSHAAEATIEAVRQATLAAQVSGRITDLEVDAGDRVRRGDLLLRIDSSEAAEVVVAAEAGVAQAEANHANAKANLERTRGLIARKFVSQSALDQAEAAFRAAEAQLRAARAGRGQAGTAQAYTRITAPFDGVVASRDVERGEMAQPGRSLLTVYDPAALRAIVDIPQQVLLPLAGQTLRARVELPGSGRWIEAAAVQRLPAVDPRTHAQRLRVELPAGTEGVVPGMFARVHFLAGEAERITVPASAVLRRGEITGVYVTDGKGGFALRQIRVGGPAADGGVEVLAGLRGGEEVALDPVQAGIATRALAARR